ncbi:MAG: aminotransferase class I/II-fold pyridoxal phosphate-dependent enzyme [Proteobacteria bacterium]|nr:aminotransferase class I/II-fold pyridoxal phosphate-dependent enzyme [Pseudomonadota bacterium]MCP4918037.1 aminotransferase class I/II-fold pyridoxal phosphate-dependent enzyme [Pseudomonadota bacterium]
MPRLSPRVQALQESAIRKLDAHTWARPEVEFLRVNIGQPDIPTPPEMLSAVRAFQPKVMGYGPASGIPACREAAARYHSHWCPDLTPADVAVTTGGSEALLFAFTAVAEPGATILAPEPYYTNYNGFGTVAGVKVRALSTSLAEGFALPDDEALDAATTDDVRALVLANPGNPTGAVYGRSEIERLVRWARRHDRFLILDEVYRRIWFGEPPCSILEIPEAAEHAICIDSLSKTWSACGLRLGFLISRNKALMERVERLGQARLGPQPLAQHVALAALSLPESTYADLRATYAARIDALVTALEHIPDISVGRPHGAFYLMARLPVDDTEAFARFLARDFVHQGQSVVVAPGPGFYADPSRGRDEIRIAAVLEPDRLVRAAELLGIALDRYRS